MPKTVELEGVGTVIVTKRRGMRSLRMRIDQHNRVAVSIPTWTPYQAGIAFAKSKTSWIIANRHFPQPKLVDGQMIGKYHRLRLKLAESDKIISTRVSKSEVVVTLPNPEVLNSPPALQQTKLAINKALRLQAEQLLPGRLAELAAKFGFRFHSVTIKKLTRRWGSCSSNNDIVLNFNLMNLQWQLIDYVILHELAHTKHHNHSKDFWNELEKALPDYKVHRQELKNIKTL